MKSRRGRREAYILEKDEVLLSFKSCVMLTMQSRDRVSSSLAKYALLFGVVFFALIFVFHNYFVVLLSSYVVAFTLMFIRTVGKRRVTMLKIEAKRLYVYFDGF